MRLLVFLLSKNLTLKRYVMLKKCKWDKTHIFSREKHCCNFLCKKCYLEVYLAYASLFAIGEFEKS